jgi:hypothetical protein
MEIHDIESVLRDQGSVHSQQRTANRCRALLCPVPCALLIAFLCAVPCSLIAAVPDGYVVKVESSTVYLDWGKASGVAAGDQFSVYRQGEPLKHPVTGEILGKTEETLGQGVIDHMDEKFSTGKLIETKGAVKAGDRTRRLETLPAAVPAVSAATAASAVAAAPTELWRSEPIKHEAIGLAVGDIDGDGKKEVVVAYRDQIEVFKWNGQKLDSFAVFKSRAYGNFLAIEAADIEGLGHDRIFASLFVEGVKRARTVVLEYAQGTLHEVARMDGFIRAFEHADGKRELLWQAPSMSRELRLRSPEEVVKKGDKYTEGSILKLPRALNNDQLFGYAWGDWDGDGSEDFAFLQSGERLRIFFKDAKWSSNDIFGGTQADFGWEDEQMGSVYPRLLSLKPATGKTQLLVPHNIPATPLRLARLKIYHESELIDLGWNGLEMAQVWRIPVTGALADFGLGDLMGRGAPQVWIAAVGAGDKTILLSYSLP